MRACVGVCVRVPAYAPVRVYACICVCVCVYACSKANICKKFCFAKNLIYFCIETIVIMVTLLNLNIKL